MKLLPLAGVLHADIKNKHFVVRISYDFVLYYKYLIENFFKKSLCAPKYGAHVTILNENIHGKLDFSKFKQYNGRLIYLKYDPFIIQGGGRKKKGMVMFYVKVFSKELDLLKKELGFIDKNFEGFHITICSNKNGEQKFQKKMISI
jgi:hypothetical protein